MNDVKLKGGMGKFAKFASTKDGLEVCNFSMKINQGFIDVTAFAECANALKVNCQPGTEIEVHGYLSVHSWKHKDTGVAQKRVKVMALSITVNGLKHTSKPREKKPSNDVPDFGDWNF